MSESAGEHRNVAEFVLAALRRSGALVEESGYGLAEAVLPDSLTQEFGTDHLLMAFDREVAAETPNTVFVAHGSPVLDAAVRLGTSYGRHTRLYWQSPAPSAPKNLVRRIQDGIEYRRCRAPWVSMTWAAECVYYVFGFTCSLRSYDKQETILSVAVNGHTGIHCPGLERKWDDLVLDDNPSCDLGKSSVRPLPELYAVARGEAEARATRTALNYRRESDRLYERDARRTREYFEATLSALVRRKEGVKDPVRNERVEKQIQAVLLDWKRRRDDLAVQYRVQADVRLDHLVGCAIPCVFAKVAVQSKASLLEHAVLYNPATAEVEPVRCPRCGRPTRILIPTEDGELVCSEHS